MTDSSTFPATSRCGLSRAQATFVPVGIAEKIGNVQSHLLPQYHADSEYSYRAKFAGYKVFVSSDLVVFIQLQPPVTLMRFQAGSRLSIFYIR